MYNYCVENRLVRMNIDEFNESIIKLRKELKDYQYLDIIEKEKFLLNYKPNNKKV